MSDFLMPVDHVFAIPGRGTVAVGTVRSGELAVGDAVLVGQRAVRCDAIERYRTLLPAARAGDTVGILLAGIDADDVTGEMLRPA